MRFFFEILLQSEKDLDKTIRLSKDYDLDPEVLNRADGKAYLIKFESNYQEYKFFNHLEELFEFDYKKVDNVGLGQYDFRITVSRIQDTYQFDNWGRPYETNDSANWYFIKPKNLNKVFPVKKIFYYLNGRRRWIWLNVSAGHIPNTEKTGFIVITSEKNSRRPIDPKSCFTLVDALYETEEEAFEGGIKFLKTHYEGVES
jgi:hypothetical protein